LIDCFDGSYDAHFPFVNAATPVSDAMNQSRFDDEDDAHTLYFGFTMSGKPTNGRTDDAMRRV